jgi:hypothetical protein
MEHCLEQQLSLHLKKFNDRVKVLNQTNSRDLVLSAAEARQLQADIFDLLTKINDLVEVKRKEEVEAVIKIDVQGGGFK